MDQTSPLFFIEFDPDRTHQPLTFTLAITGDTQIDMKTIQAKRTMIATAPAIVLTDALSAFLADKSPIICDHVFSNIHINSTFFPYIR